MKHDTIGWQFDYRYTLAHVSRYVEIEANPDGSTWCRIIPLCHGVQSRNATVVRDHPKPLAELLATPLRATWKPCPKCATYASELAAEKAQL